MSRVLPYNAASVRLRLFVVDADGDPVTGIAHNAAGLSVAYSVNGGSSWTSVTLVSGTLGTYVSGGWAAEGGGYYELGLPAAGINPDGATLVRWTYGGITSDPGAVEFVLPASTEASSAANDVFALLDPLTPDSLGDKIVTNLDATVGSRLATAGYTAPDNATVASIYTVLQLTDADVATLLARVTEARMSKLDVAGTLAHTGNASLFMADVSGLLTTAQFNAHDPPTRAEATADKDEVLAALAGISGGAGSGARSVTVTVTDGSDPLENVTVRFSEGANTYTAATDASGVATFSLDDATYTLTLTKAGYTFTPVSRVVNGTESFAESMSSVSVPTPSAPTKAVGAVLALDGDGDPQQGVTFTFWRVSGGGATGYGPSSASFTATSDANGYAYPEFTRGHRYKGHRGASINGARVVEFVVPDAASFDLPELLGG